MNHRTHYTMNQTYIFRHHPPQRRERLLDLAACRKPYGKTESLDEPMDSLDPEVERNETAPEGAGEA